MTGIFSEVDAYIADLFIGDDPALAAAMEAAKRAGLPDIAISATQGKFLYLLAKAIGARRILEIGTLAGYSAIWLARALPEGGRLVTLECDPAHARVAAANLARAGLAGRCEIMVGAALETLPALQARGGHVQSGEGCGAAPFDFIFIDADKPGYPAYLDWSVRLARPGALIVADNVVRGGRVLDPAGDENALGAAAFNARLAADPRLEAIAVQQVGPKGHDGLAIARVRD